MPRRAHTLHRDEDDVGLAKGGRERQEHQRDGEGQRGNGRTVSVIGGAIFVRSSRALRALHALAGRMLFQSRIRGTSRAEVSCPDELDLRLLARQAATAPLPWFVNLLDLPQSPESE